MEELKEEIHVKEVISKPLEEVKDSSTIEVENIIEHKPIVEDSPCVTEDTIDEKKHELPPVESDEKKSEPDTVEEVKTEKMALENETKSPAVEKTEPVIVEEVEKTDEEEKPTTEVENEPKLADFSAEIAPVAESEEKKNDQNIENELVEKSTEKIEDNIVEIPGEEIKSSETKDFVPDTAEKDNEPIAVDVSAPEPEPTAEITEKKQEEQIVTEEEMTEEKKEAEQSVPADEIALKNEEQPIIVEETREQDPKLDCTNETINVGKEIPETEEIDKEVEPIKIEEPVTDVPKDSTTKEAAASVETDKPALEAVKTTPKQSDNIIGRVKKSFFNAKKAITGKNNTNANPKTPETKEEEKA